MQGKIHLYHGDGKGKTTAAVGLSVRAAGAGKKVCFVQFLKDGSSSEISVLKTLPGMEMLCVPHNFGFTYTMDEKTRLDAEKAYTALLKKAEQKAAEVALLVLDEVIPALCAALVPEKELLAFLQNKPEELEVVLTGNKPPQSLCALADYITEMKKERHPFDVGTAARRGIEF